MIAIASDFSGIGAFEQAMKRTGLPYCTVFACEMDRYARQTYIANHGEPPYFPEDVYERQIPAEPLDVYVTTPPCQAFSISGKRMGEDDHRGILFYNSHEFITKNKPRFFIFENVKGLLSDNGGRTFFKWTQYLGGKSINGLPVIFPHPEAVPYHLYWQVLNAKDYNVPQNRERVFIVGIRDDADNRFKWPKPIHLTKRIRDIIEPCVSEKYYLKKKMLEYMIKRKDNFNGGKINFKNADDVASTLTKSSSSLDISDNIIMVAQVQRSELGKKLRRKALATGKDHTPFQAKQLNFRPSKWMNTITCATTKDNLIVAGIRGRKPSPDKPYDQILELSSTETSNTITSVAKDNVILSTITGTHQQDIVHDPRGIMRTLPACHRGDKTNIADNQSIRRLTPRECARLMDFEDSFVMPCSDSQMYKQFGNSVAVKMFELLIKKLPL